MTIYDIIIKGQKEGKTIDEINADLKAAGFNTILTDGTKTGNAVLVMGETNIEIVTVKNGKLVNGAGCGSADYVIYMGEIYHTENGDNTTLVKGKPAPSAGGNKLPATPDMSRRIDLAGQTVVQKTAFGEYKVTYDENGYAVNAIRA